MSTTLIRPLARYAAFYAAVELAAFVLLVWAFGLGWTLLILAVTFMVGVLLAASGLKAQFSGRLGAMRRARRDPHRAVTDGALVAAGSFLVFLPGVVSTAVGALMLAPPTRTAMRPLAASIVNRGIVRGVRAVNVDQYLADQYLAGQHRFAAARPVRRDYIDGEVLGEVGVDRLPVRR